MSFEQLLKEPMNSNAPPANEVVARTRVDTTALALMQLNTLPFLLLNLNTMTILNFMLGIHKKCDTRAGAVMHSAAFEQTNFVRDGLVKHWAETDNDLMNLAFCSYFWLMRSSGVNTYNAN